MEGVKVCFYLMVCLVTVQGNLCPNHKVNCPSFATCCLLLDETYGCCPFTPAVCCEDKVHCCPSGTICNIKRRTCDSKGLEIPFQWMVPFYTSELVDLGLDNAPTEVEVVSKDVKCADGRVCPAECTCCQMTSGNYGCCPHPSANCCSDKKHCCPKHYNCDLENMLCTLKSVSSVNDIMSSVLKEVPIYNTVKEAYEILEDQPQEDTTDVVCPDKTARCHEDNTCCLMTGGKYGCCPFPEATCCSDKVHCCPHGLMCFSGFCAKQPYISLMRLSGFSKLSPLTPNL